MCVAAKGAWVFRPPFSLQARVQAAGSLGTTNALLQGALAGLTGAAAAGGTTPTSLAPLNQLSGVGADGAPGGRLVRPVLLLLPPQLHLASRSGSGPVGAASNGNSNGQAAAQSANTAGAAGAPSPGPQAVSAGQSAAALGLVGLRAPGAAAGLPHSAAVLQLTALQAVGGGVGAAVPGLSAAGSAAGMHVASLAAAPAAATMPGVLPLNNIDPIDPSVQATSAPQQQHPAAE